MTWESKPWQARFAGKAFHLLPLGTAGVASIGGFEIARRGSAEETIGKEGTRVKMKLGTRLTKRWTLWEVKVLGLSAKALGAFKVDDEDPVFCSPTFYPILSAFGGTTSKYPPGSSQMSKFEELQILQDLARFSSLFKILEDIG
ncbi:hypothetical protein FB45DRAFT_863767 [Roridomyces roridus]|uniref:Uncharacterized protein n=1 Tax=Roridomyces roridus TaxID=1738132 RepID=A0AAD7FTX3_9AGAR|nr:hypothetical protein FB45DRAFT_863767 [Roridomyces roridus]